MFERLSPWIQAHIFRKGWSQLRPVQLAAAAVLFGSEDHLLLSSGTASGKTEAAFLPPLTLLGDDELIVYVSPLKALINDQFTRLQPLLKEGKVSVTRWHGEASPAQKQTFLRQPKGLLQITPESLQSLLLNHQHDCARIFARLRFVVIDEVHYFMASPRGLQLQCLLAQVERLAGCSPRRIGLSATLGDAQAAQNWLQGSTTRPVAHPHAQEPPRKLQISMRYVAPDDDSLNETLYRATLGKKAIVFANSRLQTEQTAQQLKAIAAQRGTPDVYRVHHGSVAAALRQNTERDMKSSDRALVTCATVTLELGLDIGDLQRIVQLSAPLSVASLTQRIGRCGRKGQPAELVFLLQDDGEEDICWPLVQAIAMLQLYLKHKWVEPVRPPLQPFDLLYHQSMCAVAAAGEISPPKLAQQVLTLPAFAQISQDDFRTLLRHLIDIDHLRRSETGGLVIGFAAEPIVTSRDFLSVFTAPQDYTVKAGEKIIGSVGRAYRAGERFALAGCSWQVKSLHATQREILVQPSKGAAATKWTSYAGEALHPVVLQRMQQVLTSDENYAYLDQNSRATLQAMREAFRRGGAQLPEQLCQTPQRFSKFDRYLPDMLIQKQAEDA
ncbi:MAG: DEAD/DEAH box helicase [Oscillospiraceae bacterium]|nr:DEAD/DEAH box helicase [Oscillospiraceae bacterium]